MKLELRVARWFPINCRFSEPGGHRKLHSRAWGHAGYQLGEASRRTLHVANKKVSGTKLMLECSNQVDARIGCSMSTTHDWPAPILARSLSRNGNVVENIYQEGVENCCRNKWVLNYGSRQAVESRSHTT